MTTRASLPSGATLVLESSRVLPIVSFVVAFRSGAAHDPPGREGRARLMTRMLRRGTRGMDAEATEAALDRLGAELGAEVSASSIVVYAQVLSRNVRPLCDLVRRILSEPEFPAAQLGRLVRETKAEIVDGRDNDRGLCDKFFRRALFEGHTYGRTVRGSEATLDVLGDEDVRAAHAFHLKKSDAVVAFAGDVDEATARELGELLLAGLPAGTSAPDPVPEPKPTPGRRLIFVDKPDRTQTQILIGSLGTSAHDADHVALSVATAVFGGTFTSRLMREVRSKRGWSYGASARLSLERHRHSFAMWTFPAAKDAAPCIALELELLAKLLDDGITPRELAFMQRYLVRSHAFEIDTAQKRMHQELDIELLSLPRDYHATWLDRVRAVDVAAANEALRSRLTKDDLVVTVVGTAAEILGAVQAAIPGLVGTDVVAYDAP
jgi:zinc protease